MPANRDFVVTEAASDYAIYRQVVTQLMSGEEQLPSLPTITLDIRRALSDPEVTLVQLSRLISRDPALSAILMSTPAVPCCVPSSRRKACWMCCVCWVWRRSTG